MLTFNTKLLKIIVHFYGHLGHNLFSVRRYSHFLFLNLSLCCLVFYYLQNDLFLSTSIVALFDAVKPLLSLFSRFLFNYAHQALVLLNFLHSLCRGPEVVATLNCSLFSSVPLYNDWKRLRILLAVYLLYNVSLYISAFHSILLRYLNSSLNNGFYSVGTFLALFIINANAHFYLHLLLFMQYGTLVVLRQQLPLQSSVQNVQTLALANDHLSSLVSLPLTTYLVLFLAESISIFTVFGYFQKRRWDKKLYAVYPTVTWLYIALLVYFNRKVLQEFDRFNKSLNSKIEGCTRVKVFELTKQYRARLQLRLFRLITIDASFVLACLLFTLNFVVFLVQTN